MDKNFLQNHDAILRLINNDGTTVLTPNLRLAATLHRVFQDYSLLRSKSCWQTPDILPLHTWLQRTYAENQHLLSGDFHLLSQNQETLVWHSILLNSKESNSLLQTSKTVEHIQSAWGLCKQWHIDLHHELFLQIEDSYAFYHWVKDFEKECLQYHWLTHAELPDVIIEKNFIKNIKFPEHVIMFGFAELSPQLKKLLSKLQDLNVRIHHSNFNAQKSEASLFQCHDHEEEILTVARWAKNLTIKFPQATIGCVIPFLDKTRDRVEQIFYEVFDEGAFNISAGKNLSQNPTIHCALQILSLREQSLSKESLGYLLHSPFLAHAEKERIKRARYDLILRKNNLHHINLVTILDSNHPFSIFKYSPLLGERLQQFIHLLNQKKLTRPYYQWAHFFNELLSCLGWPGERSLNSEEYQVIEQWYRILNELSSFDYVTLNSPLASGKGNDVTLNQAFQALQQIAEKTLFQAKTPTAPVQILGVLEAAGILFDYLWIAKMDDRLWPPAPRPHPFIPKRLQHQLGMPHATSERELFYCQQLTEQFKNSAKQVIFSYSETNEEILLRPSALIAQLPIITFNELELAPYLSMREHIYQSRQLEIFSDNFAPALKNNGTIHGGVNIIKQQALCPFKAFAEWRLHTNPLETTLPGLRAKDRGIFIHEVMEQIWMQLHDQQTLLALSAKALAELVHRCIEQVFTKNMVNDKMHYFHLENKRLHQLITHWLEIEKRRSSFTVITHEKSAQIKLDQLTLVVRIDRVDELSDKKKLIIDYKTGHRNEIQHWFGDRPEDPQLPLYALLEPESIAGISFAQLNPSDQRFKGISQYCLSIDGIKVIHEVKSHFNWQDQIKHWRNTLNQLAKDFSCGVAVVDPKNNTTCQRCSLQSLCRINEEPINNVNH